MNDWDSLSSSKEGNSLLKASWENKTTVVFCRGNATASYSSSLFGFK